MSNDVYGRTTMRAPAPARTPSACPACGELQCLCRPRFFPGQLLTDEDLNRLDRYILEKNKLHNRYLHGWGVVCGLEVLCHPCPGEVTVKAGYALGPCGEDIVVCKDDRVDVCALIKKCREKERRPYECEPFGSSASGDACKEATEDWFLAICYDEKPSRGITALRGSTEAPCCSRCSCGGSSACGCTCHEETYGGKRNGDRAPVKRTRPECEPTILCEGYRFAVFKVPPKDPRKKDRQDRGALVGRFMECWTALLQCAGNRPGTGAGLSAAHDWCCSVRDCLLDLMATYPVHNCQLSQKVAALCPDPQTLAGTVAPPSGDDYLKVVNDRLTPILEEVARACVCASLLPPCPDPAENPCVVLASLTVRKKDCAILRVCNWEGRKFVITPPNLAYWLSWLPFGRQLREAITAFCCASTDKSG